MLLSKKKKEPEVERISSWKKSECGRKLPKIASEGWFWVQKTTEAQQNPYHTST